MKQTPVEQSLIQTHRSRADSLLYLHVQLNNVYFAKLPEGDLCGVWSAWSSPLPVTSEPSITTASGCVLWLALTVFSCSEKSGLCCDIW